MTEYEQLINMWSDKARESRAASAERRDRVLAHPDLVARMKKPPLRMTDPERWSGWIPPRTDPPQACGGCRSYGPCTTPQHHSRFNDSPYRRELVDIAAEALRRETQPALDEIAP